MCGHGGVQSEMEGGGTPLTGAVCEMAGRWPPMDMGWALFAKRVRLEVHGWFMK